MIQVYNKETINNYFFITMPTEKKDNQAEREQDALREATDLSNVANEADQLVEKLQAQQTESQTEKPEAIKEPSLEEKLQAAKDRLAGLEADIEEKQKTLDELKGKRGAKALKETLKKLEQQKSNAERNIKNLGEKMGQETSTSSAGEQTNEPPAFEIPDENLTPNQEGQPEEDREKIRKIIENAYSEQGLIETRPTEEKPEVAPVATGENKPEESSEGKTKEEEQVEPLLTPEDISDLGQIIGQETEKKKVKKGNKEVERTVPIDMDKVGGEVIVGTLFTVYERLKKKKNHLKEESRAKFEKVKELLGKIDPEEKLVEGDKEEVTKIADALEAAIRPMEAKEVLGISEKVSAKDLYEKLKKISGDLKEKTENSPDLKDEAGKLSKIISKPKSRAIDAGKKEDFSLRISKEEAAALQSALQIIEKGGKSEAGQSPVEPKEPLKPQRPATETEPVKPKGPAETVIENPSVAETVETKARTKKAESKPETKEQEGLKLPERKNFWKTLENLSEEAKKKELEKVISIFKKGERVYSSKEGKLQSYYELVNAEEITLDPNATLKFAVYDRQGRRLGVKQANGTVEPLFITKELKDVSYREWKKVKKDEEPKEGSTYVTKSGSKTSLEGKNLGKVKKAIEQVRRCEDEEGNVAYKHAVKPRPETEGVSATTDEPHGPTTSENPEALKPESLDAYYAQEAKKQEKPAAVKKADAKPKGFFKKLWGELNEDIGKGLKEDQTIQDIREGVKEIGTGRVFIDIGKEIWSWLMYDKKREKRIFEGIKRDSGKIKKAWEWLRSDPNKAEKNEQNLTLLDIAKEIGSESNAEDTKSMAHELYLLQKTKYKKILEKLGLDTSDELNEVEIEEKLKKLSSLKSKNVPEENLGKDELTEDELTELASRGQAKEEEVEKVKQEKDDYKALGINQGASLSEIQNAYRELMKGYHPDTQNYFPEENEKFKRIIKAYDNLVIKQQIKEMPLPLDGGESGESEKSDTESQQKNNEAEPISFVIQEKSTASEKHPEWNEDSYFSNKEKLFFGVLDGVGGEGRKGAGEIASKLAKVNIEQNAKLLDNLSFDETKEAMRRILVESNKHIFEAIEENPDLRKMGTTASLVKLWVGEKGEIKPIIGNIGDSRVYMYRADGGLEQLTIDDSGVLPSIKELNKGKSQDEIEAEYRRVNEKLNNATNFDDLNNVEKVLFNTRNQLYGFLGFGENIEPKITTADFNKGDKIIIMSDGICDNLTDSEIKEILKQTKGENWNSAESLINDALQRSREVHLRAKQDDMTALVISYPG